ncbi:MAG: MerR family transcriptional regulator [Actinomycetota bacterium]
MTSATELLAIGDVARRTGVAVSAVRYYDDIGVIAATGRVGGKRRFDPATVGRVSFVRRAQEVGFSLDEIRSVLDDEHAGWRDLVDRKMVELIDRRDRLDTMIEMLGDIKECGCEAVASCPGLTPTGPTGTEPTRVEKVAT